MDDIQKQQILEEYAANDMAKLRKISYPIFIKFGGISEQDYDDFYSKANEELWKATENFDESKGVLFEIYLKGCLGRKFKTEMTGLNRIKRKADRLSVSIDTPIGEENSTIEDTLKSDFKIEDNLSEKIGLSTDERVEKYLDSLPKKAKEIIVMKMEGYTVEEIKTKLDLTNGEYTNYINTAKTNENLELFTKSFNYQEDNNMCGIMPIDTTDNYRMDKYPLGGLLDEKRDGDINCKHILQRKAFQWTKGKKNKFLTRILNNQPIPEIVICEQYVNGKKKRHLIDGLQRLSYAGLYRAKGTVIELEGAEFYEICYEDKIYDENGNPVLDEDGDIKKEQKTFNVIGKKFDELPKFLQDRFNKFNINVTTYFDCTDEQIAYHIRNYNNYEGMTGNQYEITNIDASMAEMIKDISYNHSFFKDKYGSYTEKNEIKGVLDRVVVESIMTINFLDNWKKKPEDIYEYVNNNGTKSLFDDFKESLDSLCNIVDKSNKKLFSTTNSPVWFAVFSKFKQLNLPINSFKEFTNYFTESLEDLKVDGKDFILTYKNTGTKDKSVVTAKIDGIEKLMNDFLNISIEETQIEEVIEVEEASSISIENETENTFIEEDRQDIQNISVIDFVKENVNPDVTEEDIQDYEDDLEVLTLDVDNGSKLLKNENHNSLIALIAYTYHDDIGGLDEWFVDYFKKNNTYIGNQKDNYLHMRNKLKIYLNEKGVAA